MKKEDKKYRLIFHSLDEKRHEFEFDGGKEFFDSFEQDIIESGDFKANISLEKSLTMLRLHFKITGSLDLVCDRSLESFKEAFEINQAYVYKFGEVSEVISEDLEVIPFGTSEINVARNLFEYICLAVPIKKVHPKLRGELEEDKNLFFLASKDKENENEEIDPRWSALQALKKNL